MATIVLPKTLFEKLKREAEAEDIALEELILEKLTAGVDPASKAEAYWEIAESLLGQAAEELAKGDLRHASEKIWGAAALAVKAVAYKRESRRITSHGELWEYVSKLKEELGDEELGRLWRTAMSMHVNFYEGWAPRGEVESALKDLKEFLEKLRKL